MLHMIAAVDKARGIGKDNQLLCHLSADLKHFKNLTMGHTIIMGRKTFESLPGLLPGRPHWVLTGQRDYEETHPGITVFHDMDDMVRAVRTGEEYFIIGGASLYTEFMGRADSLHLTEIDAELPADTFFPPLDRTRWQEVARDAHEADERNAYPFSFVHYLRK